MDTMKLRTCLNFGNRSMYRHESKKSDPKQDFLFFIQFNIRLPYIADQLELSVIEYLNFLDSEYSVDDLSNLSDIFALSFEKRFASSEDIICSLHDFRFLSQFQSDTDKKIPIQVHYLPDELEHSLATLWVRSFLDSLAWGGDCIIDGDDFTVFRVTEDKDIYTYMGQYLTVLIVPRKITEQLKNDSADCFEWHHRWIEETNTLKSDSPLIWRAFLTKIKQCMSRRLETTLLEFEIGNWCKRKIAALEAQDNGSQSTKEKLHMGHHNKTGAHVESITYLGEWLAELLDDNDNLVLGLFPESAPSKGIAYEVEEGDKFKKQMTKIANQKDVWYLNLNQFYVKDPDNLASQAAKKFAKHLGVGVVKSQLSLLRLLPSKPDKDSIEFLSPPLPLPAEKGHVQAESFDMLSSFYDMYLESIHEAD